ncbi:MAG: hypothetical protein IPM40_03920 [Gammaproteobacteria bacterium]|nr:hypothetical protein [Gammaproteobacteria bacterium]
MLTDAFNRVVGFTAADGTQSTTTAYDGFTVTVTDADARQTTQVANAPRAGDRGETRRARAIPVPSSTTRSASGLAPRTASGPRQNSVDYAWDRLGPPLSEDDPDRGLYSFTYDALGQMTSLRANPVLAAASQSQSMSYDLIGRLTSRTEPEGTASWTYDTGSGPTVGRLVSESVGGFSRSYTYDAGAYGKPSDHPRRSTAQSYTLSQSYDAAGRPETFTYPRAGPTRADWRSVTSTTSAVTSSR